ncbi:MAG: SDR family oxidoreductase [Candidatus Marinimicrobia bacterium]|nr:SDR family oxidoreductase [Candidatus Neomarinimicrobiota bacterium]
MVILISGVSSGIGKACAEYLSAKGHIVYGTSRNPISREKQSYVTIEMDVNESDSVRRAVEFVKQKEGRLDAVVNNAGFGIAGPLEETSVKEAKLQFETNFFGAFRVFKYVLPIMKGQGSGYIINIGSIGGLIGVPFQGIYSAAKFALTGISESLSKELYGTGINVVLIHPGDTFTHFTQNRIIIAAHNSQSDYSATFFKTLKIINSDEQNGMDPTRIARIVNRILKKKRPRLCYIIGKPEQKLGVILKHLMPGRIFERIINYHYGIK